MYYTAFLDVCGSLADKNCWNIHCLSPRVPAFIFLPSKWSEFPLITFAFFFSISSFYVPFVSFYLSCCICDSSSWTALSFWFSCSCSFSLSSSLLLHLLPLLLRLVELILVFLWLQLKDSFVYPATPGKVTNSFKLSKVSIRGSRKSWTAGWSD